MKDKVINSKEFVYHFRDSTGHARVNDPKSSTNHTTIYHLWQNLSFYSDDMGQCQQQNL